MKNQITKLTLLGLVAAALVSTPLISFAQDDTNSTPQVVTPKKHKASAFHGKVSDVDATAQTFTVGSMTITVTPKTKIMVTATGEAGTFADITVGAFVSGTYKKTADGTLNASSVHIGKKKKKAAAEEGSSTNSATAN